MRLVVTPRAVISFVFLVGCSSSGNNPTDSASGGSNGKGGANSSAGAAQGIDEAGGSSANGGAGSAGKGESGGSTGKGGSASGGAGSAGKGGSGGVVVILPQNCSEGGAGGAGGAATAIPTGPTPDLTPGIWKNITPADLDFSGTFGSANIGIDPSNPFRLYATADLQGLWRSEDGGSTWTRLGDSGQIGSTSTHYLDNPIFIRVDPCDPLHLYATDGARGQTQGFWVSSDGGETWNMPVGFQTAATTIGTHDMTQMSVDPLNFKHVIVGSHSAWKDKGNAGILETTDGGDTFTIHDPVASWSSGSMGVHFLFNPEVGLGDSQTWLVATDGDGFWRTSDSGANWNQVETWGMPHGGNSIYYSADGVLYAGGYQYPVRSTDNGVTWAQLSTLPYAYYYTVQGDGNNLYTLNSFAAGDAMYDAPYQTSAESDGLTWTPYQSGAQHFDNGPFTMRFDSINRIMYSANWTAGIWALKVIDP